MTSKLHNLDAGDYVVVTSNLPFVKAGTIGRVKEPKAFPRNADSAFIAVVVFDESINVPHTWRYVDQSSALMTFAEFRKLMPLELLALATSSAAD